MTTIPTDGEARLGPGSQERLQSVDVLRAIAATTVFIHHIPTYDHLSPSLNWHSLGLLPFRVGHFGVPLFLVLSGFCIHSSVAARMAQGTGVRANWGYFWRRRFTRLYPPYLVALGFAVAIYYWLGVVGHRNAVPEIQRILTLRWDLATHLLLIHNLFDEYCFRLSNGPFWTLGLAEQLYALYVVYLLLRRHCSARTTVSIAFAVSLVWSVGSIFGPDPAGRFGLLQSVPRLTQGSFRLGQYVFWPFAFWFCWVLGALAAESDRGVVKLSQFWFGYPALALFALLGIVFDRTLVVPLVQLLSDQLDPSAMKQFVLLTTAASNASFAVAGFILINRWTTAERKGKFTGAWASGLAAIGTISYSLYLTHFPLIHLGTAFLPLGDGPMAAVFRTLLFVPVCLAFAALFYWAVERHFLRRPSRTAAAEPVRIETYTWSSTTSLSWRTWSRGTVKPSGTPVPPTRADLS